MRTRSGGAEAVSEQYVVYDAREFKALNLR